jgi:hypothetical protein
VERFFGAKLRTINEIGSLRESIRDSAISDAPHLVAIQPCFQSSCSVFVIASSARNAALDICRVSSPYHNGSYLIPLTAHGASGWILYCSCRAPPASSQWSSTELKPYEICRQAYRRGYGSPEEVSDVARVTRIELN